MRGSLGEFRLAEILQLVALQQKTGLLRLVRGEESVTFYFDRGILVSSRDRRQEAPDPLLDYMTRTGWLEAAIAGLLRARMRGSKDDLAGVLLLERYIGEDDLRNVLEDLAQEMVSRTFDWRSGTYEFIGGDAALTGLQYRIALQVDSVLMEAARRADEWARLAEKLPGPDVILEIVEPPSPTLDERTFDVLSRIAGRTALGELVRRCRRPEFEVYEVVAQAAEAGLVRLQVPARRPGPPPPEPFAKPVQRSGRSRRRRPRLRAWVAAAGVSLAAVAASRLAAPGLQSAPVRAELRAVETAEARERIRMQIEIYRAAHGRYPEQLADLVADDLTSTAQLARAAPLRYAPMSDGRGYQLTAPPPGGEKAAK